MPNIRDNRNQGGGKWRMYKHSPSTLEHDNTKVSISENGKVTFTQINKDKDTQEEVEDQLTVPASLIFKVNEMLLLTKKSYLVDREDREKELRKHDDPRGSQTG